MTVEYESHAKVRLVRYKESGTEEIESQDFNLGKLEFAVQLSKGEDIFVPNALFSPTGKTHVGLNFKVRDMSHVSGRKGRLSPVSHLYLQQDLDKRKYYQGYCDQLLEIQQGTFQRQKINNSGDRNDA